MLRKMMFSPDPTTTGNGGGTVTPPPPAAPNAPTTPAPTTNVWTEGFNDDLKGYIGTKGFKDSASLADAYRNLEKLQGVPQDRLLKLPERFYDDQGKITEDGMKVFKRLGAPEKQDDYNFEVPKEGGTKEAVDQLKKVFFEAGVPKSQAETIIKNMQSHAANMQKQMMEQGQAQFKDQEANLKKDWGQAYEGNLKIAQEGAKNMGFSKEQVDGMSRIIGHDKTMKFMADIGKKVGEAPFISGSSTGEKLVDAETAKYQINQLKKDGGFAKKLMEGDSDANARWTYLHKMAFDGQVSI